MESSQIDPRHDNFSQILRQLKPAHDGLCSPSEAALEPLEAELEFARKREHTTVYILACTAAITLIGTVPVLLIRGYRFVRSTEPLVRGLFCQPGYLNANPEVGPSCAFAAFAAIVYAVLPFLGSESPVVKSLPRSARQNSIMDVDRRQWRFIAYCILVTYAALGVWLVLLCSYSTSGSLVARLATGVWLYLPVPLLSLLPSISLLAVFALIFRRRDMYHDAPQAAILLQMLLILDDLKNLASPSDVSSACRRRLMNRIARVAEMLRWLYARGRLHNASTAWASQRMSMIADDFLSLSSWIASPKDDTLVHLKARIVNYTNVVVAGTYDTLHGNITNSPKELTRVSRRAAAWRQAGGLLATFVVVSLPLAAYVGGVTYFRVDIPAAIQSAAGALYSGWVVLCLLAYMNDMAPEAKTMVLDVVKSVLKR